MAVSQISDVVVPEEFSAYVVQKSVVSSAFSQSGVMIQNGEITSQLNAGANQFTAPYWNDLSNDEANRCWKCDVRQSNSRLPPE